MSASVTLAPPHPFPGGTTVSLYKGTRPPSGLPSGSPVATGVVDATTLTLAFPGVEEGRNYFAYANGQSVYVSSAPSLTPVARRASVYLDAASPTWANNKQALYDAVAALPSAGGTIACKPYDTYDFPADVQVNKSHIRLEFEGATFVTHRVHAADQKVAFAFYGSDIKLHYGNFLEANKIADRRSRLYFTNGELVRIGNTTGFEEKSRVIGCTCDGGYTGALSHRRINDVYVYDYVGRNAFGDALNSENAQRDVHFEKILVEDAEDDLCIIKGDLTTVPGGTVNAVMEKVTARRGDAKGICWINVASGKGDGLFVDSTNSQGIAVMDDTPDGLGPANKVVLTNFHIFNAGQWFGADAALYKYTQTGGDGTGPSHGLYFANGTNLRASHGEIFNSNKRGAYAALGGTSIGFDDIDIQGAGAEAWLIGDVNDTDVTKFKDVAVTRVRSQQTVGGGMLGSCTGFVIDDIQVRTFLNAGGGSRRGLHIGNVKNGVVGRRQIDNDDAASATVLQTGTNTNVEISPHGLEVTAGTRSEQYRVQAVNYAASITPDLNFGAIVKVQPLTGPITVNAPTQAYPGASVRYIFTQDATGGRVITFSGSYKVNWTPDTGASKVNTIEFFYDNTTGFWRQIGAATGLT